jgi:hypothetical protein
MGVLVQRGMHFRQANVGIRQTQTFHSLLHRENFALQRARYR